MTNEIRNSEGERLDYSFHAAAGDSKAQLLIIGHGVTANKDRPWAENLANKSAETGIPALRFSFSGNGDSEGKFTDSCVTKEVADLGSVIDAAKTEGYESILFAGHSMGGAVAILRTAQDDRISKVIALAPMVHTKRFAQEEFGDATPDSGFMWDDEDCPLSSTYMNDLTQIGNVVSHASQIKVPLLIVHGVEDDLVPVAESRQLLEAANEPKKLVEIAGADHVFSDDGLQPMLNAALEFLA